MAFLADALAAFGDRDTEDLRRVKAVVVLANPARAVELLAAFAALRARTVDEQLALEEPGEGSGLDRLDHPEDTFDHPEDTFDHPEGTFDQPGDALGRMDAFARRVGFTPTRLPTCLGSSRETTRQPDSHSTGPTCCRR